MPREPAHFGGKVAAIFIAFGAISLAAGAWQRWRKGRTSSQAKKEDVSKKRPHSSASTPEHSKRICQGVCKAANSVSQGSENASTRYGAVPDVTALLAAKIAVPETDQSDPAKLGKHYEDMASKFLDEGLKLSAVDDARKYFQVKEGGVEPLEYLKFETPLSRGAVRLGVFRVIDVHPDNLATEAYNATRSITKSLPEGTLVHCNAKEHYHVTVQMISHPSDPRPDTFTVGGGIDMNHLPRPIPAPSPQNLQKEQDQYKKVAGMALSPALLVHSVVLANSGALLLLFTDTTGLVQKLRKQLKLSFPGASEKQPSILHVTLARILSAEQISAKERRDLVAACEFWTNKLRGKVLAPKSLWHVQENTFTLVNDNESSVECRFMSS